MLSQLEKEEQRFKMLSRILRSTDGPELLEYLNELSSSNYNMFKRSAPESSEFCKGYAVCVDSLITALEGSTAQIALLEANRLASQTAPENEDAEDEANPHD